VVDVTHDRDHRGPRREVLRRVFVDLRLELFLVSVLDLHFPLELGGDQFDLLVGEGLRDGLHRPKVHEDLHDLRHGNPERGRELLHGGAGVDLRGPGRLRRRLFSLARLGGLARSASVGARPRRLGVDDDPALSAAARGSAPRPQRSLSIGHLWRLALLEGERIQARGNHDGAP
jgi:hypothetical protein